MGFFSRTNNERKLKDMESYNLDKFDDDTFEDDDDDGMDSKSNNNRRLMKEEEMEMPRELAPIDDSEFDDDDANDLEDGGDFDMFEAEDVDEEDGDDDDDEEMDNFDFDMMAGVTPVAMGEHKVLSFENSNSAPEFESKEAPEFAAALNENKFDDSAITGLDPFVETEEVDMLPGFDGKDTPLSDEYDQSILVKPAAVTVEDVPELPTDLPDFVVKNPPAELGTIIKPDVFETIEDVAELDSFSEDDKSGRVIDLGLTGKKDIVVPAGGTRRLSKMYDVNQKLRQKAQPPQLQAQLNGVNDQLTALTVMAGFVAFVTLLAFVTIRKRV